MKRRDFIKGSLAMAAAVAASGGRLEAYHKDEKFLRVKDAKNPNVLEQKHVPLVVAPQKVPNGEWFVVTVKVGYMRQHPTSNKHWITSIRLAANGVDIAKTDYPVGGAAAPEATFRIKLNVDTQLEAIEHCNLHGTWISEPVQVDVYHLASG